MTQILKPLVDLFLAILNFFNGYVHSYGWSIILLTIVIRIFILPLAIKQAKSMREMQKLQPKIKALQEKHKGDRERLGKETMKLYQEHKVNPLSGCLPLILQLPVFFALFTLLRTYKPLVGANFYVLSDLSKSASAFGLPWVTGKIGLAYPYYILVVLIVLSTYLSQKQVTTDPSQARLMMFMPLLMGAITWALPAGVLLYWVVFNGWMIVQQYAYEKVAEARGQ
ncbi:MAG: YidC/Oxa1 family membrane protein insertase [Actinomycetota bacterium]